ncbi:MAG: hypothetical protein RLZZ155_884, partial [Bacteroidota bacterium]
MGLISSLLGKTKTITLLAREVRINENPASGEDFMYIEGD